jgi:hypothetical protein
MPSIRRILAGLGAVALAAALVALLSGPWLRVRELAWEGQQYTSPAELEEALAPSIGVSALAVDTQALNARLVELPSVAEATVEVSLTGHVEATVVEPAAAFLWETRHELFIGAADGTLFVELDGEAREQTFGDLPRVRDLRFAGRILATGDVIPEALVRVALRLSELDPVLLGSDATRLAIEVDDEFGFRVASAQQEWEIAFGVYGQDPNETMAEADARLDRQVTAVRTLFAAHPESELAWVDVRNPGKVYFRAKG